MKRILITSVVAVTLLAVASVAHGAPACTVWEDCGQWASWEEGGYILYNNIWGDGAGDQCIWACSHSYWGVWADHPDTTGVKSYPNSGLDDIDSYVGDLESLTSSFDCTVPTSGDHATTYDIWSGRKTEIMLWMNKHGDVGPWADAYDENGDPIPKEENVTVGGHTWDAYYNGGVRGMHVVSLIRTSNTNSGTVDILACLNYIISKGWIGDVKFDKVQLGFEISSSPGGMDFTMNSFDVSYSTIPTSAPAAPTDLTADVASSTSVELNWVDAATSEDGYSIERSLTSGSGFAEIATVGANTSTYTDEGLETGTTYYYRVRAYNDVGYSEYSNEAGATPIQLGSGTGLAGEYYDNADLTNLVMTRTDATINFDWGNGSPDPAIGPETFSVRWTGYVEPLYSETYTFETFSDDGDRLWVDGVQLTDDWKTQHGGKTDSGTIALTAGVKYPITLEFMENTGGAAIQLHWSSASQEKQIVPMTQLYPQ